MSDGMRHHHPTYEGQLYPAAYTYHVRNERTQENYCGLSYGNAMGLFWATPTVGDCVRCHQLGCIVAYRHADLSVTP